MPARDRLLAVLVAVVWGLNFVAIHVSLAQFPPFFLVAVRFAVIAIPTVLLVPRPAVPWRWVLGYGLGFGTLQFLFLYLAMDHGMPTGLASLVLQSSAPFTVLLAVPFLGERPAGRQWLGVVLAVGGLAGIGVHRALLHGGATLVPVLLTICAGLGWAMGNLCNRRAASSEPFRLMLWMTVVPPVPMFLASLAIEGPTAIRTSLVSVTSARGLLAVAGLAFTVLIATVAGSGIWTALMSRHPSSTVAPHSMLVPVVGIAASWLLLRESTSAVELAWGAVVVAGVLLGSGARLPAPRRSSAGARVATARVATARVATQGPAALSGAGPRRTEPAIAADGRSRPER
jgi:O-acetylserine/cysteine efflux transporter